MATYTVIQDIEAEDKFLGPLTLKQFIFGAGGLFFAYLCFFAASRGGTFLLVLFVPPALLGFFLAIPWSSEQPTEVWVLAKLRFKIKPKARVWDQSGLEELVKVTAPKKIERQLTNGLDPTEVQSRLKALAETIDTRGWAVKNATLSDTQQPGISQNSQRLLEIDNVPREVPDIDLNQYEDVLDEDTTVSENFNSMIQTSSRVRRQQSLDKMDRIRHGESLEAVQQPEIHFTTPAEPSGQNNIDEQALSQQLRNKRSAGDLANSHMQQFKTPFGAGQPAQSIQASQQAQAQMTNTPDADILNLAQNNDLNIDTIARQAKKNDQKDDEVVISLR